MNADHELNKADHELNRAAQAWLAEGPTTLSGRVLEAVAQEIHSARQRRVMGTPDRFLSLPLPIRMAAAVMAGFLVVGGLLYLNGPGQPAVVGGGPTPVGTSSPTPTVAPTPSPSSTPQANQWYCGLDDLPYPPGFLNAYGFPPRGQAPPVKLDRVEVTTNPGFDRIVFTFGGPVAARWHVAHTTVGFDVELAGIVGGTNVPLIERVQHPDSPILVLVHWEGDHRASADPNSALISSWGVEWLQFACIRYQELSDPGRLVLDVNNR